MKRFINPETFIGMVLYGITLALVVFFSPQGWSLNPKTYTLSAVFRSIAGLQPGNRVVVSGVAVGEVTGCQVDPQDYTVRVTFTLQEDLKLPVDSHAEIVAEGLMGSKSLAVIPGVEQKFFSPGDVIKSTRSPIPFEGLLRRFLTEIPR